MSVNNPTLEESLLIESLDLPRETKLVLFEYLASEKDVQRRTEILVLLSEFQDILKSENTEAKGIIERVLSEAAKKEERLTSTTAKYLRGVLEELQKKQI